MKRYLKAARYGIKKRLSDVLYRLLSPTTASPALLVHGIKQKFGETHLLQQLWLHHLRTTPDISLAGAHYSLLADDGIDGMVLYLFARGGFTNRVSVDIGAGNGINGNTANLVLFHDFKGYMLDCDGEAIAAGGRAYTMLGRAERVVFVDTMLTSGTVAGVCATHGIPDEVDLLSIDIDSIDLYVAEQIPTRARIIVVEFNNLWGPDESYSVPNVDGFRRELGEFLYGGASLRAFAKVLAAKNYKLVGVAASGFDAFFVLDTRDFKDVPAMSPQALYDRCEPWQRNHNRSINHPVRRKPWVAI